MEESKIKEVCKIGQRSSCCRYLAADATGFVCLKLTELKSVVDEKVQQGQMVAQEDNCDGELK